MYEIDVKMHMEDVARTYEWQTIEEVARDMCHMATRNCFGKIDEHFLSNRILKKYPEILDVIEFVWYYKDEGHEEYGCPTWIWGYRTTQ